MGFQYGVQYYMEEHGCTATHLCPEDVKPHVLLAKIREKVSGAILVRRPLDDKDAEWQEVDQ